MTELPTMPAHNAELHFSAPDITFQLLLATGSDVEIAEAGRRWLQAPALQGLTLEERLSALMRNRRFSVLEGCAVEFTLALPGELLRPWSQEGDSPLQDFGLTAFLEGGSQHQVELEPAELPGQLKLRVKVDLRGLLHYLAARAVRPQTPEVTAVTQMVFDELAARYPLTMQAWSHHVQCALRLSAPEQAALAAPLRAALNVNNEAELAAWVAHSYPADTAAQADLARKLGRLLGLQPCPAV